MDTPTPMETYLHIVGAVAMQYDWYRDIVESGVPDDDPLFDHPDRWVGWQVAWTDDDSRERHTIDHPTIMRAIRKIADKVTPEYVSTTCVEECRAFIFDRDDADFDADTADQVIQVAAFGKVIYG